MAEQTETLPRYRAIKDEIITAIREERLKPGDRVASETEIIRRFDVSRMTANRALRELAQEGLVTRQRGAGSFVAEKRRPADFLAVRNIADEIRERGQSYDFRLLDIGATPAGPDVAEALELAHDAPVFHFQMVHLEDGRPVQVEDRHVNPASAPGFLNVDFSRLYPGTYLHTVAPFDDVEHSVEAIIAEPKVRALLEIGSGEPCLRLVRRTWSRGRTVSFIRFTHPGRLYRMTTRFQLS
jgi:GntR family histidine utilization transcriptional repressor